MSDEGLSRRGATARKRLLAAAHTELSETGELEVAAVARRAGVSVGLPYRYFGSRSGLLTAVIADFYDRLDETVTYAEFPGNDWRAREHARVVAWVNFLYDDPLAPVALGRFGDAETAGVERQRLQQAIEVGARNMAQGQQQGMVPADRDPELLVAAVLGGVHMAVAVALTRNPRPDRTRVADQVWQFVAGATGFQEEQ
ncbi:TetR/AcrR family transcriptional regulator [Nocardia sp. NBC_00565]|uniref:TetR/AcrR family transcriptional regulator n=1 Tax=Nocardia sp. NBC_00565 TaxID=2975993 RepID=UPI002E800751|nr:TetR/AcrR family transcriptional regulator [Nocardia sp. NBC_00565]WUC02975.1 TetR/AcrR family transcriptional regulator [Nocardia sp. NBC_00565]